MLTTKTESQDLGWIRTARPARAGRCGARSRATRASSRIGAAAKAEGALVGARRRRGRDRGRSGRGTPRRTASARAAARSCGACIAGRILGPADVPSTASRVTTHRRRPARGPMFRPVSSKPDLVAQEHEILDLWRERRTFARLRAQNAGGPALELPRRADHGQQPDGRPPRLGPDVQGPLPALPRDARRGPALAERLRLPGPVGRGQRRARPRLHEQARHRGVRHRRVRDASASSAS